MDHILHQATGGTTTIHLNRPEKLNALSPEMMTELGALFTQLKSDTDLRAVILTGTGNRAFCAGTDISELANRSEAEAKEISERGQQLCDQIVQFPVPVIAAVNGIAAGGGVELLLACHLRFASTEATFSLPETKLGLIPAYGGTQRLAREVGAGPALELLLTGKTISAEEAMALGLVNRLSAKDELLADAMSQAHEISELSPLAIRAVLKAVTMGVELSLEEGLSLEALIFASLLPTEDAQEGIAAFLEKRTPSFKGK